MQSEELDNIRLSDHAVIEMSRRSITESEVREVLARPGKCETVRPASFLHPFRRSGLGDMSYAFSSMSTNRHQRSRLPIDRVDWEVLEQLVKVIYDRETDTLTVTLKDTPVAESDEDKPGVILDFDEAGEIVGFEILEASKRVTDPARVEFTPA